VRYHSVAALFGLRLLLVANIVLVTATGALCFIYYQRPEAYLFSGVAWSLVAVLVWLVRRTDPYRRSSRRRPTRAVTPPGGVITVMDAERS
jgi:hypothetical protein